jgi:hypothetical protein
VFLLSDRAPNRLAIVSTAVPPASSGQARVLGEILAPGTVPPPIWFSDRLDLLEAGEERFGRYIAVTPARFTLVSHCSVDRLGQFNNWGGLMATVFERARQIVAELKRNPVDTVIGASGSPFDIPSAWLATRRMRLPFAAWLFDDPVLQWPEEGPYRGFARFWERFWATKAIVLAPNEIMAEDFARRHPRARAPRLVRNPAASTAFAQVPEGGFSELPIRIVYTGSIYSAQADAVRDLIEALEKLEGRFELHIYSAQTEAMLAEQGLNGRFVRVHPHLSHAASLAAQQQADVLFLPLAFASGIPEVIRSSAPAKLGEYLASLRPVLVHAPPGSFVCKLIAESGAGLVVDTQGANGLIVALRELENPDTRSRLLMGAQGIGPQFRVEASRKALCEAIARQGT